MSYRFYTSQEYAKLNAADERRRLASLRSMVRYPIQIELADLLYKVPKEKQAFARFLTYAKKLSPKQIAAAEKFVVRAKAA